MGALLHLFAVVLLLFNESLAQKPSSPDDCARSQTCTNAEPYKSASLTSAERAYDLLRRMTWEEELGQMGGI
jgi:hypothetical protein